MGTFEFHAEPLSTACSLGALPSGGFDFEASVRHFKDGSHTWLTLGGITGDAGFDGQYVTSVRQASRVFNGPDGGACALRQPDGGASTCKSALHETLVFALLSEAQSEALGSGCPADALDGGVPFDPDAGINRPGSTGTGFDAVRACGELFDEVSMSGGCETACLSPCSLSYRVSGVRK